MKFMRYGTSLLAATTALVTVFTAGCGHDSGPLQPATASTDPVVFRDAYSSGGTFEAFLDSKTDAVQIDTSEKFQGTASLRVIVPGPNDPSGFFAGGAFTTNQYRDLSGYDAITFYAKASMDATLDVAGLGNDNTGTSKFTAQRDSIQLTTTWTKVVIPIPLPEKLTLEQGLFFFAEGYENNMGYTIWFDEIVFEKLGTISNPRPSMPEQEMTTFVGADLNIEGTQTIFDVVEGVQTVSRTVKHMQGYFTFASSDSDVVSPTGGEMRVVGAGTSDVTATLGDVAVTGTARVTSLSPPTVAAQTPPARDPANVISLFSNAYEDILVIHWAANWTYSTAKVADIQVAGDDVKAYTQLNFAGVEWTQAPDPASMTIDATDFDVFHMDIWVPSGTNFKVELVDFGEDGIPGFIPDAIGAFNIPGTRYPQLVTGSWMALDIPLDEFVDLWQRNHLGQLVISSSNAKVVYVDNVYFYKQTAE